MAGRFVCALGLYGGKPYLGNCTDCARRGENTPGHAAALFASAALTHPPDQPAVSGCCDPADP